MHLHAALFERNADLGLSVLSLNRLGHGADTVLATHALDFKFLEAWLR